MGRAGRGRSRRWAPCASCLLGRRYDPIRRGGNLRVRQRGRGPVAREGWRPVSAPHKLGRSSDEAMLVLQMSSKRGQSSEDSMESDVNACRLQLLITQSVLVPMLHLELERPRPPAARGKWSPTAAGGEVGWPAAAFYSGLRRSGDAGARQRETSPPPRHFK
uniref:Uncharacterized protein n=1 Tax=Aegilops tauschii subsp. strangulata TaxID=200361 RepID=A0A453KGH1_AEGTS